MSTVLHLLDHSRPLQSGYASRSHSILKSLADKGYPILALTGPKHGECNDRVETIDGIQYMRSGMAAKLPTGGPRGQLQTIRTTRQALRKLLREKDIALVHAHSPCLNGLSAIGCGVPVVYEMRSSWEDAAVSEGITTDGSVRYKVSRALESLVVRRARHTFVICDGLRQELIDRDLHADRVTVVPNALQESMFEEPAEADISAIIDRHGLAGRKVIAYYGSFFDWEGLDALVAALPAVVHSIPNAVLLLAGGGRTEQILRDLANASNMQNHVIFAGRVDADEMRAYYRVADVMVYPRKSNRLTEMVTPVKPLEAMAQYTPTIASDIGGHRELIENGVTGFLYHGQVSAGLAQKIIEVLSSDAMTVIAAARSYVEKHRRWSVVVEQYRQIYERYGILSSLRQV